VSLVSRRFAKRRERGGDYDFRGAGFALSFSW
jgi:hypothetical protein